MAEENDKRTSGVPEAVPVEEPLIDETDVRARPGWREIFRQAFDKARREQRVTNRRDLGRDRKSFALSACWRSNCGSPVVPRCVFLFQQREEGNRREATGNAGFGASGDSRTAIDWANGIGDAPAERTNWATRSPRQPRCHC